MKANIKKILKFRDVLTVAAVMVTASLLSTKAHAATVHSCNDSGLKCVVKVEEGMIGDHVKVLDEKARPIASGRIIRKKGSYAIISVSESNQSIRKGYPVIVNVDGRGSSLQWAASFGVD